MKFTDSSLLDVGPLATFIHFVCISVSNNISVSGIVTPRESTSASTLGILTDILCSGANELLQ